MTSLETRKQLLITESELNRAQLVKDWTILRAEAQSLAEPVQPMMSLISTASAVVRAFTTLIRSRPASSGRNGKHSWLSRMLYGVQTGAALWQATRIRRSSRSRS